MVDLALLQSVSYIAGALGVCVAAFYYVMNLRETNRNRRITYTNSVLQHLYTEEGHRREMDCYAMQWTDFEDFKRKYDSRVNPENYCKRMALWSLYESLGYLCKSGLIDLDTVDSVGGGLIIWDWAKFKPIIEDYRKTDTGPIFCKNFEYIAEAVSRKREKLDPGLRARMALVEKEHIVVS